MTTSTRKVPLVGAERAIYFIEKFLKHTKGRWAGSQFILAPWQKDDIIKPLFGTLIEGDEPGQRLRQYRTAYIEIPRKNGKSELAAAVALYLLFYDKEAGGEIYGAAADRDQASIVFNVAAEMVRRSPELSKRSKIIDSQKRIVVPRTGSFYRAIPAEAAGSHGYNASAIIFDELHTQPNRDLWDVLTTSSGARSQPLTFAITTAGYDKLSICYEQHDYAERVLRGAVDDPSYFAYIRKAEDDADWKDEAVWRACNPALGDDTNPGFRNIKEMREKFHRAAEVPALQNTVRRLYLNQWTSQATRWLDLSAWDACDKPVEVEALAGRKCFAGLDLASTTDIAALVLCFPPLADGDDYRAICRFFIPGEALRERENRDRVPYSQWVREGYITATEGNVIHYSAIRAEIDKLAQTYDVVEMAFDRWGATQMTQELDEAGMTVIPFGQGFASMSPPTKELLNIVLDKKFRHGGNPVLRWMADNVVVETDPAGNLKPSKKKSAQKIDGIVALIMALARATERAVVYKTLERGLITL
jgi:phage terminase large subunit-like protein